MKNNQTLSIRDLARLFGCSSSAIIKEIRRNDLRSYRLGEGESHISLREIEEIEK